MKIKQIKKLKSGKYQILFDNGNKLITYDDVILKYNLLFNKDIESKIYNEINKENDYYGLYTTLVKKLSKKIISKKEYYKYIEKFNLKEKDKIRLTSDLEKIRLLDDNRYLKAYISDKFYLSNDGPQKIKKDLIRQGINQLLIDEELSKISREDIINKLTKLINKKLRTAKGSNYMIKQKIYHNICLLGYSKDLIDECYIEKNDNQENLKKDFYKIYNYYDNKEDDKNKLYLKIKLKLYQKGYSLSEIDSIINDNQSK